MPNFEFGATAQHWFNVVLIWVGFGTVAGLLARWLLPVREVGGAVVVVTLGILGSVLGPLGLSYFLKDRLANPLSPLGLLAATAGAFLLLALYRVLAVRSEPVDEGDADEEDDE